MNIPLFDGIKTFWALFYKEVLTFSLRSVVINALVWSTTILVPTTFFMHKLGMPKDYALFLLPAMSISWGFFDIMGNATTLVGDITGDKKISYELILPLPQWAVFFKIGLTNAWKSLLPSFVMLGWGLTILYLTKGMVPVNISLVKVAIALFVANLFHGFTGLLAASYMPTVADIRHMWMRFLMPLWWIGGFQYNWATMYSVSPNFARFMLLDPMVYLMETARVAVLGQEGFLPFWSSIFAMVLATIVAAFVSIRKLKKRLDCL